MQFSNIVRRFVELQINLFQVIGYLMFTLCQVEWQSEEERGNFKTISAKNRSVVSQSGVEKSKNN